jgi:hypothetical protein
LRQKNKKIPGKREERSTFFVREWWNVIYGGSLSSLHLLCRLLLLLSLLCRGSSHSRHCWVERRRGKLHKKEYSHAIKKKQLLAKEEV